MAAFSRVFGNLMSAAMLGAGVWLVHGGWVRHDAGSSTRDWLGTTAKVRQTSVEKYQGTKDPRAQFCAVVQYDYEVRGKSYVSRQVAYRARASYPSEVDAQSFLESYPVGGQITCYFDPLEPSNAVLVRGASAEGILMMILGGFAGAIGLVSFFVQNRRSRE